MSTNFCCCFSHSFWVLFYIPLKIRRTWWKESSIFKAPLGFFHLLTFHGALSFPMCNMQHLWQNEMGLW